jgi:hypothetical protein
MKKVEYQQRSEHGGFPTENGVGAFEHGESVYIVSKRELMSLLYRARLYVAPHTAEVKGTFVPPGAALLLREIDEILMEDVFVEREPDLPTYPLSEQLRIEGKRKK